MIGSKTAAKMIRSVRLSEHALSLVQLDALLSIQLAPGCAGARLQEELQISSMMLLRTIRALAELRLIHVLRDTTTSKRKTPLLYLTGSGEAYLQSISVSAAA